MTNTGGQGRLVGTDAAGKNAAYSDYELLVRLAALDLQVSLSGMATGRAVDLVFPSLSGNVETLADPEVR